MPETSIQVPFGFGGLDLKTAEKAVQPARFLRLENVVFTSPGELLKRNGYDALGQGIDQTNDEITVGNALIAYNSELLECDLTSMYSYATSTDSWTNKGAFVSTSVTQASIVRNNYGQSHQDGVTTASGLQLFAWEQTNGGVWYEIRDSATGQAKVPPTLVDSAGIKPKTLVVGSNLVLYYINTTLWTINRAVILPTNPTAPLNVIPQTPSTGGTSLSQGDPNYDAEAWGDDVTGQLYLTFRTSLDHVMLYGYGASNLSSPINTLEIDRNSDADALTVFQNPQTTGPVVLWYSSALVGALYAAYSPASAGFTLTTSAGLGTLPAIKSFTGTPLYLADGVTPNGWQIFGSYASGGGGAFVSGTPVTLTWNVSSTYTLSSQTTLARSIKVSGKAWCYAGLAYVPTAYTSNLQNSYWVIDQNGHWVSKHIYQLGGGFADRTDGLGTNCLPESSQINPTTWRLSLLQQDMLTTLPSQVYVPPGPNNPNNNPPAPIFSPLTNLPTVVYTQTGIVTNDLNYADPLNSYLNETLSTTLHLSGGFISQYDGVSPSEHGFHFYIELPTTSLTYSTGAGGSIGSDNGLINVYWITATYEWTDNQGNTHISAPSVPIGFNTGIGVTNASIAVKVPTLRLTNKQGSPVIIKLYRTTANGSIFYAAINQVLPVTTNTLVNQGPVINNKTVDVITFNDGLSDTALQGNQQLYTTGNVLENIEPNASSVMTVFNNRLLVLDSTNPLSFWYSKPAVPGTPIQFSEFLTYNVDPRGGNVTALQALDTNLIVFKETSIYYITGDGADNTGNALTFSTPFLVTTDCGATNQRSIVVVPGGLIFQSPTKGWHLLVQGSTQVTYIGAEVNLYNDWTCTSAQLIPNTNQVRFTVIPPPGSTALPVVLVYDYYASAWSIFTPMYGTDSALFEDQFCYVQPDGQVLQENPDSFSDNGSYISMLVQTAWLQFAGVQGFQRLKQFELLYTLFDPCNLSIGVAYNFNPAIQQQLSYTPGVNPTWGSDTVWGGGGAGDTTVWGGSPNTPTQVRILPNIQKCESMSVTISDSQAGPTIGQGCALSGLRLDVTVKRGSFKIGQGGTLG